LIHLTRAIRRNSEKQREKKRTVNQFDEVGSQVNRIILFTQCAKTKERSGIIPTPFYDLNY
tara:strand:+ start:1444 stop:1626 length:183 start_codon:yes stop_codon:yes gene_type:complete